MLLKKRHSKYWYNINKKVLEKVDLLHAKI